MIAFKDDLPLLERPRGTVTTFSGVWLRQALKRAAQKAGYAEWWLAEDLTRTVVFYLRFHYRDNTIPIPQLKEVIRAALREIGYDEIAQHFGTGMTLKKIFLPQVAQHCEAAGLEAFLQKLASRIQLLRPGNQDGFIHFSGLEECVSCLQTDGEDIPRDVYLATLKTEIVGFVRTQLLSLGWEQVRFSIS